jgi:hypothetical protein
MTHRALRWLAGGCIALGLATTATAQTSPKKALVQRVLQSQQGELEGVAHSVVERPAAQILQQAARAIQASPADKREALGQAVEAEVHKYVDEAYPLVRERALRIAPATVGAVLEEKMSEDELKQLVAWLDSPVARKYQQLSGEMRDAFIQKLLAESQPVVDPKLRALDGKLRVLFGAPAASAPAGKSNAPLPARPAASARPAGK